ncbi:sulfurtransferase [Sphingobacterium psychroaquaticum]|uniref:Thiosulfate/3-mercaptopyruvate sulfurtransferase n=1 Tax=Sphingobacterium psychroaquaticum TaxID=561061 RepID=A0A1X7IJK8_9SPHI|nr:sulfurtransferase [Sphingobacterium psychroaquaticum]SMG14582.1 thiosulfate/3-mercaptopyruvate sulfurtransferase [Sphingobacterium psychroaquaticum]
MNTIISTQDLMAIRHQDDVIIIDATGGANTYQRYQEEHLEKAIFVDLDSQLSAVDDPKLGGRHPLPSILDFGHLLTQLGITKQSRVIVYDRLSGANAASRFWWMMRAIGHPSIQVLDGGFQAAKASGYPLQTGVLPPVSPAKEPYPVPHNWLLPTINMQEVELLTTDTDSLIIDVREAHRYEGIEEPIDLIAGHIPSAINIPLANNTNEKGLFKSTKELKELYGPYVNDRATDKKVVHCGSGVSACQTLLALEIAGFELPQLYIGSWSEWSRNK